MALAEAQQQLLSPRPFEMLVTPAPEQRDVIWANIAKRWGMLKARSREPRARQSERAAREPSRARESRANREPRASRARGRAGGGVR